MRTRVVVPLIPLDALVKTIAGLNPIGIEGHDHVFAAQSLATLTIPEMGRCIGSLMAEHGNALAYALDILLTGF